MRSFDDVVAGAWPFRFGRCRRLVLHACARSMLTVLTTIVECRNSLHCVKPRVYLRYMKARRTGLKETPNGLIFVHRDFKSVRLVFLSARFCVLSCIVKRHAFLRSAENFDTRL